MVKKKGKPLKQAKKRAEPWLIEDVRVHTALPPQVEGQLRCFCRISINQIIWLTPVMPDLTLVRVKWWGEEGNGSVFKPVNVKKGDKSPSQVTARYPVRSGPRQFAAYLNDMGTLPLEVMSGEVAAPIGLAEVPQIGLLSVNRPINGFFPVFSPTEEKLAELQVSVVLEPLMASYDSMGSIPTSDISVETHATQESTLPHAFQPRPHFSQPVKPQDDPFISPASNQNAESRRKENGPSLAYTAEVKQRLQYDMPDTHPKQPVREGSMISITAGGQVVTTSDGKAAHNNPMPPIRVAQNFSHQPVPEPLQRESASLPAGPPSGDLLSVLLERGRKLRDAMAVSSVDSQDQHKITAGSIGSHDDVVTDVVTSDRPVTRSSSTGSLLKEILRAEKENLGTAVTVDDIISKDLNSKAVDMVVGSPVHKNDLKMYQMLNGGSPGASVSSDAGELSEAGDPLQEESILQELFYRHSESDGSVLSEMSGDEREKSLLNSTVVSVEDPANVRPPSRRSSVSSLTLQFPEQKKKKRSSSKTRKKSRTREKTKVSKVPRSRSSSRSRSRTRTRPKLRRKASSGSEMSDSEVPSTPRSEMSRVSFDMTPSDVEDPVQDVPMSKSKSVDGLSVERLTLLGRVHVARVSIDALTLHADPDSSITSNKSSKSTRKGKPPRPTSKSKKPCTYFIEYQFPVVATSRDKYSPNTMATEVMRVASKNIKNKVVTFNHRSVFPIMFDGSSIDKWWKSALVFKVFSREAGQKIPCPVGSCGVSLKSILKSESLCLDKQLEVREANKNTSLNSSLKSSLCGVFGHLKATVELASDHREFATALAKTKLAEMSGKAKIVPIPQPPPPLAQSHPHPPLPQGGVSNSLNSLPPPPFAVQTKHSDLPAQLMSSHDTDIVPSSQAQPSSYIPRNMYPNSSIAQIPSANHLHHMAVQSQPVSQNNISSGPEPLTLHMLLMIPEGRNLSLQGVPPLHLVNKRPMLLHQQTASVVGSQVRDSSTRNAYLVCRMFWCNDAVNSTVCWGSLQPQFNFLQVAPVLMTQALLERMRNNFLVIEVWDKKTTAGDDKLIGMVKLSLHQFYMSFRDQKVASALLKSQYPVVAADNYFGVTDPFTSFQYGQLRVVLAMGSAEQVASLQRIKHDGDGSVMIPERPFHSLERIDLLSSNAVNGHHPSTDTAVEHVFEVVIEGLRGLKLFDNMMWGETDCFIQYQFPAQAQKKPLSDVRHIAPTMKCYRTATTLCTPDPTFHDCTRHKVLLPEGTPVQRELLTACANSGGGAGGLPFEVWCRYYHPNIREQVIAKATLPLAKLCAMVTMQKRGEPSIQSFSLPLSQVAAESEVEDTEARAKVKDSGLMDVTVHYKTQVIKTELPSAGQSLGLTGSQVCVSVGVIRATGLKAAAEKLARLDPGMQYASEVGVNTYVRIKLSFLSNEGERITKTVARTFSPEFSHYLDFPCPLLWNDAKTDGTSLAELLETGEATFEVWHQVPGLHSGSVGQYVPTGTEDIAGRCLVQKTGDVLLGTTTVHLSSLLSHRTGLLGWYPVNLPTVGWSKSEDDTTENDGCDQQGLQRVGGGLELSLRFAHQEDREKVIHAGRSVGWSPTNGDLEEEGWISEDEESHSKCHHILLSIQDVCFPIQNALLTGQNELDRTAKCYVRYKFYDKAAVSTKLAVLRQNDQGYINASFRHKHSFVVSRSSPFHWYLREERLEVQVWVSYGSSKDHQGRPRQRDKLIGSGYIDLESLDDSHRKQHRISGVYPVFKPGAAALGGACVRAHITSKLLARGVPMGSDEDEDVVELGDSDGDYDPEDSFHQLIAGSQNKVRDKFPTSPDHHTPTFAVYVFIERAMHLPLVSEKNKCGESQPSTYVSYQTAEKSTPSCTPIFPQSVNPTWDHEHHTHLSTELLYRDNKNLVLKVWHKPAEASKQPDKSSDRVLGFVSVDLAPLASGLMQICGWYNILDFNGQCKGQIKVSIVPDEPLGQSPQPDGVASQTSLPSRVSSFHSSFPALPPSFHFPSSLPNLQDHVVSIRHHHQVLQQQLEQRLHTSISAPVSLPSTTTTAHTATTAPTTHHWQPKFPDFNSAGVEADPSKSYLFSSLRKQLDDLDSITTKLKEKLRPDDTEEEVIDTGRSGIILNGTQSGLSTIHTVSSQDNQSQNVATSHSSNLVADSGAYSVENSSENSQRSERPGAYTTPRDNTGSDSGVNRDMTPREQRDSNDIDGPQVLVNSARDFTNIHGQEPALTDSGTPREILLNLETPRDILSNYETSQGFVPGQMLPSVSQGSVQFSNKPHPDVRSNLQTDIIESVHDEGESESDDDQEEQFGNYHRYREMLDNDEVEADDEGEGVEIITPRRINDVSGMLAGYYSGRSGEADPRLVIHGQSQGIDDLESQSLGTRPPESASDGVQLVKTCPGDIPSRYEDDSEPEQHTSLHKETGHWPRTLVDSWLSENRDMEDDGSETPREGSFTENLDEEATPRKMPSSFSGSSKPTLLSNVELLDTLTSTLEKEELHSQETQQIQIDFSKKQHLQHLLSNVDLESVTSGNTSHRPDSGSSKVSGRSSGLSSSKKNDGAVEDVVEDIEEDLEWTVDDQKEQTESAKQELESFFQGHQKQLEVIQSVSTDRSAYATLKHLSLSGDVSAHSSSHSLHHTIQYVQGYDGHSQTEIHSDRTTEDSGLESGTKSSQDEKEAFSMFEADPKPDLPNFFMPPENLQASMRALQAATAAATQVGTTTYIQDPVRYKEKAQAASELTKRLSAGSKVKFAPVSAKGRQLPTAEEARRIAKIFASKIR